MKTCFFFTAGLVGAVLTVSAATKETTATSDLLPPGTRHVTVELAKALTRPPAPAPVPAELPNPFNPQDFDQPDPEEIKAGAAAAVTPGHAGPAPGPGVRPGPTTAPQPAGPATDRDILGELAARLVPSGTVSLGGRPRLLIGTNRFEVGTKFGVVYNGQDYELELVAIDRTTFTLRYRGEEITRPIKPSR